LVPAFWIRSEGGVWRGGAECRLKNAALRAAEASSMSPTSGPGRPFHPVSHRRTLDFPVAGGALGKSHQKTACMYVQLIIIETRQSVDDSAN
jgi:hypothetical protein